jgi:hypothetical protein
MKGYMFKKNGRDLREEKPMVTFFSSPQEGRSFK